MSLPTDSALLNITNLRPVRAAAPAASAAAETDAARTVTHGQQRAAERMPGEGPVVHEGEALSFWDVLDVVNPLQHLPIVSTLYREITGDTIKPAVRVAGGALFGGPLGAGAAVAAQVAEQIAGIGPNETLMALFRDETPAGGTDLVQTATAVADEAPADAIARYALAGPAAPVAEAGPASAVADTASPETETETETEAGAPDAAPAATSAPGAAAAGPASFMPITAADFRAPNRPVRMPVPEAHPPGLAQRLQTAHARAAARAATTEAPDGRTHAAPEPAAPQPPAGVLGLLAAQGIDADEAAAHPMIRAIGANAPASSAPIAGRMDGAATGATASESVAAARGARPAATGDWFGRAMMSALDRYEASGRLARHVKSTGSDGGA